MENLAEVLTTNEDQPQPLFDVDKVLMGCDFPAKFIKRDWALPVSLRKYAPPTERGENGGFRDFKGLFLTGATGTKKTASMCLLAREWICGMGARGRASWRFVSFPELCLQLQEAWGRDAEFTPSEIINDLAQVPFLVLDEIGAEKTTEFVLQSTYTLLNRREWDELPLYGTSNLGVDELSQKMDPRIASRIKGMCHIVEAGGPDMRAA